VKTNAAISCHRKQVKEDAANAESSKGRHVCDMKPVYGATISNKSGFVTAVIVFETGEYGPTVEVD